MADLGNQTSKFTFLVRDRAGQFSASFDAVLDEYANHYNGRRPHRGQQPHPPRPDHPIASPTHERIKRRQRLGGLINEYERAA
ncbi:MULTISPECIES: hypothetical protein [unclassified Streptomyces]|uniref:hypothetical protein n=1 Tax=unclassified Streptomyces TaxID=2593676 RepID=UPI002DD9FD6A|nr:MULTISPECIES: hypothetical protein [unclassified Streptomyces]WSD94838.1 hypothetical protein OG758_12275 [Streptomyces sp. NBC_01474]